MVAERDEAQFLVRRISELLKAWDEIVAEDAKSKLRSFGYDPDKLAKRGPELMHGLLQQQVSKERTAIKQQRLDAQALAKRAADEIEFNVPSDVDQAIRELQAGRYGQECQQYVQSYFRNLQEAGLEDKIRLLRDIQLLAAMVKTKEPRDKKKK